MNNNAEKGVLDCIGCIRAEPVAVHCLQKNKSWKIVLCCRQKQCAKSTQLPLRTAGMKYSIPPPMNKVIIET